MYFYVLVLTVAVAMVSCGKPSSNTTLRRAIDGDTYKEGGKSYRLADIDAPELSQHKGKDSQSMLQDYISQPNISITTHGTDIYGRTLVTITSNGTNVNRQLVLEGLAHPYGDKYISAKHIARSNRVGVWSRKYPTTPSDYRRNRR